MWRGSQDLKIYICIVSLNLVFVLLFFFFCFSLKSIYLNCPASKSIALVSKSHALWLPFHKPVAKEKKIRELGGK